MLSRRLESGLSTDELRIILCRVTMRNTKFTWGVGQGEGLVWGVLWGPSTSQCKLLAKSPPQRPLPRGFLCRCTCPQVPADR